MQLKQQPTTQKFENILPLVNVVFLLLIFFMLAGAFSKPDAFKVVVPTAENDNTADRKVLTILMNSEGELALDNTILSSEDLKNIVTDKVENGPLVLLQLKADANASATRLVDVMENLSDTGLNSIHLLTVSPDTKQ
jgi:biopolymer transport protein ExbD